MENCYYSEQTLKQLYRSDNTVSSTNSLEVGTYDYLITVDQWLHQTSPYKGSSEGAYQTEIETFPWNKITLRITWQWNMLKWSKWTGCLCDINPAESEDPPPSPSSGAWIKICLITTSSKPFSCYPASCAWAWAPRLCLAKIAYCTSPCLKKKTKKTLSRSLI